MESVVPSLAARYACILQASRQNEIPIYRCAQNVPFRQFWRCAYGHEEVCATIKA